MFVCVTRDAIANDVHRSLFVFAAEKPEIQRGPDSLSRAVEGQNVLLPCETFGAPMPKVYWSKRDQVITGGR
jgi:hypothetical protein